MKIILKNCRLTNGRIVDILVEGSKIIKVSKKIEIHEDQNEIQTFDVRNMLVMPGMIDVHTHMRDFDLAYKEDYHSGSFSCLSNGITTFCDMPNSKPETTTLKRLEEKIDRMSYSCVNCFPYIGIDINSTLKEVKLMLKKAKGIKIFLNNTTGDMKIDLSKINAKIFELDTLYLFHAEGSQILDIIDIIKNRDTRIHICHISSKLEFKNVLKLKKHFNNVTFEVCPHHLLFNENSILDKNISMVKPSLKSEEDRLFLINKFINKKINIVASDHAPHLLYEKTQGAYGFPGVETILKILLTICKKYHISLSYIEKIFSFNPAKLIQEELLGKISPNYQADIIVVDEDYENIINENDISSKCQWSPYTNEKLYGRVLLTMVKGVVKYDRL
ncbi:MAG: amidohydrolase family protein [Mycoplasmoidaceae bacterium]